MIMIIIIFFNKVVRSGNLSGATRRDRSVAVNASGAYRAVASKYNVSKKRPRKLSCLVEGLSSSGSYAQVRLFTIVR